MPKIPFMARLQQPVPLVADGAMGTQLHLHGYPLTTCFEALNVTEPDTILSVHHAYVVAGADLIETNTFGANRYKLGDHNLAEQVTAINRAGVALVKRAIAAAGRSDTVYIAGSVGPLGQMLRPYGRISKEDARAAFVEQIVALAEGGVDVLLFETFAEHAQLLEALAAARAAAPHLPVICQATFTQDDQTLSGFTPSKVAFDLYKAGADVIGVNCSGGPAQISTILQTMAQSVPEAKLSAMPNAGYPETVGGRVMYPASAEYFGDYALTFQAIGARIIGGCCGTTPDHIAAMRRAVDDAA
ncbi:MAG TPA: homocysteine S-methyltransferase family protein, partial [Aggregatilineales bacterium]|nr:homocysteine S-methyltransferase family protein [Aggregatilineales bacterium]